jgi:hypothetical protein
LNSFGPKTPQVEALAPGSKEAEAFQPQARWELLRLRRQVAGLEVTFSRGMPVLSGAVAMDSGDKLYFLREWWAQDVMTDGTPQSGHATGLVAYFG